MMDLPTTAPCPTCGLTGAPKDAAAGSFFAMCFLLGISPLTELVTAKICALGWEHFLESQYGIGPSIRAWFGLSFLLSLGLVGIRTASIGKKPHVSWAGHVVGVVFFGQVMRAVMLVGAGWICFVWGWT